MFVSAVSSSASGAMAHANVVVSSSSKTDSIVKKLFLHHPWLSSLTIGAAATAMAVPTLGFTAGIALGAMSAALSKLAINYLFTSPKTTETSMPRAAAPLEQNQTAPVAFNALSSTESEKDLTLRSISSLSTSSASPSSSSSIASDSPMIPDASASMPPIGLRRLGMNCWANALFQFIISSPSYTESLKEYPQLSKSGVSLAQMAGQYKAEQKNPPASGISSIETQNFREILNTLAPHVISEESSRPQDPYLIFACLNLAPISTQAVISRESPLPTLNQSSGSTATQLGENHTRTTVQTEEIRALFLRKINSTDNLETLLDNSFKRQLLGASNSSSGKHSTYKTTKIQNSPQDLTIALQGPTDVAVPRALKLEKAKHTLNENADYILDSFILGINPEAYMHYIAYVRKNGIWFKCNDDLVSEISEEEALNAAKKAYMLHFSKVK